MAGASVSIAIPTIATRSASTMPVFVRTSMPAMVWSASLRTNRVDLGLPGTIINNPIGELVSAASIRNTNWGIRRE